NLDRHESLLFEATVAASRDVHNRGARRGRAPDDATRYAAGVVMVDPAFERISRSLTLLELRAQSPVGTEFQPGDLDGHAHAPAFVDVYTEPGLRRVLEVYGLKDTLTTQKLTNHKIQIHQNNPFHHHL